MALRGEGGRAQPHSLRQSCFGESATGAFASCGTRSVRPRPTACRFFGGWPVCHRRVFLARFAGPKEFRYSGLVVGSLGATAPDRVSRFGGW